MQEQGRKNPAPCFMKLELYNKEGWINCDTLFHVKQSFVFAIGARQIGKTYSTLKYCVDNGIRFAYIRRSQSIVKNITSKSMSVFKELNEKENWNIQADSSGKDVYIWKQKKEGEKEGETVGYTFPALSTSNLRGFSGSDIDVVIYDEFIPEIHERRVRGEFDAFMNLYSTINRNRELQGKEALRMICLANSNNIVNPILSGMDVSGMFEKMEKSGKEYAIDYKRGILCIMYQKSPVSERLKETALYKASVGTDFNKMAFSNGFAYNDRTYIKKRPIIEYFPICRVVDVTIMKHKYHDEYYITRGNIAVAEIYKNNVADNDRFRIKYSKLYMYFMDGLIYFDTVYSYNIYVDYMRGV